MRVLIVDDDFRRHYALKRRLVGITSSIVSVYRARAACEALAAGGFDVVFLDFDLVEQVGDAVEWWDDFMENNGLVVARAIGAGALKQWPARVVVHSLNHYGARAMREAMAAADGVLCTLEPWCWSDEYRGLLWEELEAACAAG